MRIRKKQKCDECKVLKHFGRLHLYAGQLLCLKCYREKAGIKLCGMFPIHQVNRLINLKLSPDLDKKLSARVKELKLCFRTYVKLLIQTDIEAWEDQKKMKVKKIIKDIRKNPKAMEQAERLIKE